MSQSRLLYEFDPTTKREALDRVNYTCEICGREEDRSNGIFLQAHHKIAIWFARENPCLALEVIKSLANCEIVCRDCHSKLHNQETRTYYEELSPIVLSNYLNMIVDHDKDNWRWKGMSND